MIYLIVLTAWLAICWLTECTGYYAVGVKRFQKICGATIRYAIQAWLIYKVAMIF